VSYSLSDVTVTSNNSDLTSEHDIGSTLDTVDEGLSASVKVVELGLGNGVVDVDGRNAEFAFLVELVKVVNTGGGLLRDTVDACEQEGSVNFEQLEKLMGETTHPRGGQSTCREQER